MDENKIEGPENDDLYEHFRFIAQKGQQPLRVDKYLMNYIENATRSKIQQAAKDGMRTLAQDAILKVLKGDTDIAQVQIVSGE